MKDEDLTRAATWAETQHLKLAALNLQHFLKIEAEQVTLENIVAHVRQAIEGELHGSSTDDLDALLVAQAKMLDATFSFFLHKASTYAYTEDEKVNLALKAQRQSERTIKTLRNLRARKEQEKIKKFPERNEQNAPLD